MRKRHYGKSAGAVILSVLFLLGGCTAAEPAGNSTVTTEAETTQTAPTEPASAEAESSAGESAAVETAKGNEKVVMYFVRHGKTGFNTTGRVQGWSDTPLTESGVQGAIEAGIGLKDIEFATAYSSDLGRAVSTAEYILGENSKSDVKLVQLSGIREKNYGGYEGLTNQEMWQPVYDVYGLEFKPDWSTYPQLLEHLSEEEVVMAVVNNDPLKMAETHAEVVARTEKAIEQIIADTQAVGGGNALVVSHGGEISTILDLYARDAFGGQNISNCSVSTLIYEDGEFTLDLIGDTGFLEKGRGTLEETEVTLYLLNTGKTQFLETRQIEGWADSPLVENNSTGSAANRDELSGIRFVRAYTSDMSRATKTMDRILADRNQEPDYQKLEGLRDWGYGGFEGKPMAEVWGPVFAAQGLSYDPELENSMEIRQKIKSDEVIAWISKHDEDGLAESYEAVSGRTRAAVEQMIDETLRAGGGDVIVVSHGNEIALIAELFTPDEYRGEPIPPDSLTVIRYQGGVYTLEIIGSTGSETGAG